MREHKGKSIIAMPSDFVVIDLETTGLSPEYDEIIEIACIRFRNNLEVETFHSLVRPHNIALVDDYITNLTGITHNMLQGAPSIETILVAALDFIGEDILLGHNASFDVNFLYDNAERLGLKPFNNDYIDTMRLARRFFPSFKNYKLGTLVKEFGIPEIPAHRAEQDARQTARCYAYMSQHIAHDPAALSLFRSKKHSVRSSDITGNPEAIDLDSPLYGKTVVFTGTLDRMLRKDAMQIVADLGGINGDGVTKKTNFLVLGNNDMCKSIKDGKSNKQKKAEQYILAGADLMIISENTFYDMLTEKTEVRPIFPEYETLANITMIPAPELALSHNEKEFVQKISDILSESPNFSNLKIVERSSNYLSVVLGQNDFLRFKTSSRAKWISLRLPANVRSENQNNPFFAAQKNKAQLHWKAEFSALDDLDKLRNFILVSCRE